MHVPHRLRIAHRLQPMMHDLEVSKRQNRRHAVVSNMHRRRESYERVWPDEQRARAPHLVFGRCLTHCARRVRGDEPAEVRECLVQLLVPITPISTAVLVEDKERNIHSQHPDHSGMSTLDHPIVQSRQRRPTSSPSTLLPHPRGPHLLRPREGDLTIVPAL